VTTYLFVGPTLSRTEIGALCDFVCLPPAAQGDVLRLTRARPRAIGIIDGYFDGVPAVWHKEILWAMTQGIHVFGGASMGALRAAELHPFGMRGIGRIFEAYRSGGLEDDDEVAVLHGPAETGYVTLSEPLVNIRATLEEAERAGIIGLDLRVAMIERAKQLFYQDRSWERLLVDVGGRPSVRDVCGLREWLPRGRVDRKRLDACDMIAAMSAFLASDPGPLQTDFHFEWTDMWDVATQAVASAAADCEWVAESPDDWVLDELRLDEAAFASARQRAMLRRLAADGPRSRPLPDAAVRRAVEQQLRSRLALFRRADVERWCGDNGLNVGDFARLVDDEAQLFELETRLDANLGGALLDELRVGGDYAGVAARARDKRAALAECGRQDVMPADLGMTPIELVAWYFEKRLGRSLPEDVGAYGRRLGLAKPADFYRLLAREWLYSRQGKVGADRQ
jgi:hypothetical protein